MPIIVFNQENDIEEWCRGKEHNEYEGTGTTIPDLKAKQT